MGDTCGGGYFAHYILHPLQQRQMPIGIDDAQCNSFTN